MLLSLLLACVPAARFDALVAENAQLQADLQASQSELSSCQAELAKANAKPRGPNPADEAAAQALYNEVTEAITKGDIPTAKAKLDQLLTEYPSSRSATRAQRTKNELDVVGKAELTPEVEYWFQGDHDENARVTILVFFEVWCPHCRRELPELNATWSRWAGQGLQVEGYTKLTKTSTDERVREFLAEQDIGFAIAKETGAMSQYYAVSGIPAVAVVQDHEVIWRGHPGRITDDMIRDWLN